MRLKLSRICFSRVELGIIGDTLEKISFVEAGFSLFILINFSPILKPSCCWSKDATISFDDRKIIIRIFPTLEAAIMRCELYRIELKATK